MECYICKGKFTLEACGKRFCPIYSPITRKIEKINKPEFYGDNTSIFIGRYNYPNVNAGFLSIPKHDAQSWLYDCPEIWSKGNFTIPSIVAMRSNIINARFTMPISAKPKLLLQLQETAISEKPLIVETRLEKLPFYITQYSTYSAPIGASAKLKKISIIENPKVASEVEKVFYDTDLKAADAIKYLYTSNITHTQITRLLSASCLGTKRKLTPTRWAITATDDIIGKHLISKIKQYEQIKASECLILFGGLLGNYYLIALIPEKWSFELFELHLPHSSLNPSKEIITTTDYEGYNGRKTYAEQCSGGYYACRLAVLEKLNKMKKQASALILRFITKEYTSHLGVWVCREAARKALPINKDIANIKINDTKSISHSILNLVKQYFNIDISWVLKKSILLANLKEQRKLSEY